MKDYFIDYWTYRKSTGHLLKLLVTLKVLKLCHIDFIYPQAPSSADEDVCTGVRVRFEWNTN